MNEEKENPSYKDNNKWITEVLSYLVPVPIIDGVGHTARYISTTKIITQTNLSVLDLQEERERDEGITSKHS